MFRSSPAATPSAHYREAGLGTPVQKVGIPSDLLATAADATTEK